MMTSAERHPLLDIDNPMVLHKKEKTKSTLRTEKKMEKNPEG